MRSLLLTIAAAAAALAFVAPAAAENRFVLDSAPGSPGHVVVDAAGTAYVAWTHRSGSGAPDSVMFCKVPESSTSSSCESPKTLAIPGAVDHTDDAAGAFPVLGAGSTVYVIAPRYVEDDVIVWTSSDGGQTFNGGTEVPGGYSNKSEPTNVFAFGSEFAIGAFNPGLGFGLTPAAGTGLNFETFNSLSGTVGTGSLAGISSSTLVMAYWTLDGPPYSTFFYRYKGVPPATSPGNWEGPIAIGSGYETKVAAGAGGIFLVSQDYAGGSNPSAVDVRKYTGTSFGPPLTLANDASTDLFAGGAIAESPAGRLAVAWPEVRAAGQPMAMRLFSSTDGTHFTETDIAGLGSAYAINDNAQLAIADSGAGWLTFIDEGGLHIADTAPIPNKQAPPHPLPPYKGKEKTIGKPVGGFELTLRLPKSCLQPGQPFYAGAGKRVRHKVAKAVHSKLTLKTATFFFDGRKLKTLKKKPLKLLIEPGTLPAGSKHQVKVRITAIARRHGKKGKKVVRTLKGTIVIC